LGGFVQDSGDVDRSDAGHGLGSDAEPGVVVDDVEDLEVGVIGDADVGDVCLPALVREVGLEADVAALGPLVRFRGDEAAGFEDPPDRRDRRRVTPALNKVVADRLGAGVEAAVGELLAERDHRLVVAVSDARWAVVRSPRARYEADVALLPVAGEELVQPAAMDPMRGGELGDRPPRPQMRLDQEPTQLHRRPPTLGVSDVLTHPPSQVSPMS
jgi:hypothetical protein